VVRGGEKEEKEKEILKKKKEKRKLHKFSRSCFLKKFPLV